MRRPRLSTRRLMLAVALLAIMMGFGAWMTRRSIRFKAEADRHQDQWLILATEREATPETRSRAEWHFRRSRKLLIASWRPWLPVRADPEPMPE